MQSRPTPDRTAGGLLTANGFPRFSDAEMRRRHEALQALMDRDGLDAVVVSGISGGLEHAVHWLTNWAPLVESVVVLPAGGEPVLFARLWNHLPDARRISWVTDVRYGGDTQGEQTDTVATHLRSRLPATARIGWMGGVSAATALGLRESLPAFTWADLSADYAALRLVKSEEELTVMRFASELNDRAILAMRDGIRPGLREREIPRLIEDTYLDDGAQNLIHFTLTTPMGDPSVAVPHQQQPDRIIRAGDVVVTEISTLYWGYAGQVLRSFTVAADPTPEYARLHDVATATYDAILTRLRAGVTVGQILDAAEGIHEAGFTIIDDLVHGQGGRICRRSSTPGAPAEPRTATSGCIRPAP